MTIKKVAAFLFGVVLGFGILAACDSAEAGPVNLNGEWASKGSDVKMEATVGDDLLEVYLLTDDGDKGLYWKGTFPVSGDSAKHTVTSVADVEALEQSLFGSGLEEKDFVVERDTITLDFTMMGVTSDVKLAKQD